MARIFISIGSNIHPEGYFNAALKALSAHFDNLCLSSVFESEAVGFDGSNFLNMVVAADTQLGIAEVVALFKQIETDNGRLPGAKKFSPRTLDLDLLLYDDLVTQTPIPLPRAEITTNAFVLWPLAEIAPERVHPVAQLSYQTLWDNYDKSQQKLWPIEFQWSY
ncbi:2-amino-4-hydroxy-6-hydroxymethyldihydropteridine diphosphokinase [Shewanella insulae]|uniref:2-amino-4-hydroxy-6- hydroxymethyldihydropteridine diphosphokinase n=1 Tax=Shewanella insulae TaxID=2681496 RepID=UPI001EFD53E2|nr:2-amino-4-hydroxy-6-hydroxymethyldihydropteridine diphosphokinase [Shewanella insulae]MCG9711421.1 2-amino-4-hydroxy-6-hydroxymethyldihydropteridine diphosphokinase [Shewanella insulae]MCG9753849.1 2-amino-4-hydroxy-6-hydroxymethyldihydropteridine diphosphokinase [Shewanella insulae]